MRTFRNIRVPLISVGLVLAFSAPFGVASTPAAIAQCPSGCTGGIGLQLPEDSRIGLVLSGGGARGLAHIGVIKVLEQHGIKADVVTGTSMGAIVGALYASGLTASEIEEVALKMDWRNAFSDASPRRSQPYPFRQLEAGMTADLRMSVTRSGITFPRGVIEGQHLQLVFGGLFLNQGRPRQFEDLPIAFAAVAANLETGQSVVMKSGDLATAVRASMSIPGALAPTLRDGQLLVDGGIADNMPVNIARQMGADLIIAVDVSSPLRDRGGLNSILDVANQTTAFLVKLNTQKQRANLTSRDILIAPSLEGFSAVDFDQAPALIEAGMTAGFKILGSPKDPPSADADVLAVVPAEGPAVVPLEAPGEIPDTTVGLNPVIDFIEINNNSPISDRTIRSLIRQREGEPLQRVALEEDMQRLYGLDYFSLVHYQVVERQGKYGLAIVCSARRTGNSWLKMGVQIAEDFRGNSDFALSGSIRSAGHNRYGGTSFGRIQVGSNLEFEMRYLQPMDSGLRYFIEPGLGYQTDHFDFYLSPEDKTAISSFRRSDTWMSLAAGRLLWREVAEFRIGITREQGSLKLRSGLPLIDTERYDDGFYFARVGWDSLDDLGFPSEGARWSLTHEQHATELSAEANFARILGDFTAAIGSRRNTLLLEGDLQFSESDTASFADVPFIGGFLELSGLPPKSRFGRHRGLLRGVYLHRLGTDGPLPFGVPLYLGLSAERGNVWYEKEDIDWHNAISAGSLFIGSKTPLGPAFLSFGFTEDGRQSVSVFLGQRFR